MITIILNGETHRFETATTVAMLVHQLELHNKRLAVEINRQIVPASTYASHPLQDNDQVEIVQAIGGG